MTVGTKSVLGGAQGHAAAPITAHQPPLPGRQAGVRAGSGVALLANGSVDWRVGRIHDALTRATGR